MRTVQEDMDEVIEDFIEDKHKEWLEEIDLKEVVRTIESEGVFSLQDDYLVKEIFWGSENSIFDIPDGFKDYTQENWLVCIEDELLEKLSAILNEGGISVDSEGGDLFFSIRRTGEELLGYLYSETVTGYSVGELEKETTEWSPASEFEASWPGVSLLFGMCARPTCNGEVDPSDSYIYCIEESVPLLNAGVSKLVRL